MFQEMAERDPNILKVATASAHQDSAVGQGCDDQFEFEFALDLLLDGFGRLHRQHWTLHSGAVLDAGIVLAAGYSSRNRSR
jgi:hypothetical protein